MKNQIQVLDHGFVRLCNLGGPTRRIDCEFDADDRDPANTARMSFDQMDSGRLAEEDLKLCRYLMKNWHTTPFEMIEVWLEMKLPIFLARQFVRHRTCTINEVSARYITLPEEWYIPAKVGKKPENAKQGQTDGLMPHVEEQFKEWLNESCKDSYMKYTTFIGQGVAPEHARLFLHMNHYTHWMWKQDLHNMMHFLSLRADSHAQVEAQIFANAIITLLSRYLPHSMKLFWEYRTKSIPQIPTSVSMEVGGNYVGKDFVLTEVSLIVPEPVESKPTQILLSRQQQEIGETCIVDLVGTESNKDPAMAECTFGSVVADLCKKGMDLINDLNPSSTHVLHMAVGISGEVAELLDAIDKFNNQLANESDVVEECGDLEFYLQGAVIYQVQDIVLEDSEELSPKYDDTTDYFKCFAIVAGDVLDAAKRLSIYAKRESSDWIKFYALVRKMRLLLDAWYEFRGPYYNVNRNKALGHNMYKLVYGPKARYKGGVFSNKAAQERADKS